MKNIIIISVVVLLIIAGTIVFKKPMMTNSPANNNQQMATDQSKNAMAEPGEKFNFTGEKGEILTLNNNEVKVSTKEFEINKIRFFNTTLSDGKTIYYLILKDKDGNFRVAANANEQCAEFGKGYKQEGDQIICITCQKTYSVDDFAKAEPDCNPKPINPSATILDNQIIINQSELEKVANLF